MKRILLVVLVVCLLAGQASAGMYIMNAATAIDLRDVTFYDEDTGSSLGWVGYNDGTNNNPQDGTRVDGSGVYGENMYYDVGFRGTLNSTGSSPYASVDIGAAANTNGVLDALKLLGSFGSYGLYISNDNDDTWEYQLYAEFGSTRYDSTSSWTSLTEDTHTFLTLSFGSSDLAFSGLTDIGFTVRGTKPQDVFHTSVVPVPAAVLLGVLGLGVVGLKLRKYA